MSFTKEELRQIEVDLLICASNLGLTKYKTNINFLKNKILLDLTFVKRNKEIDKK